MLQVSRNKELKIPKQIKIIERNANSVEDTAATKQGVATALDKHLNLEELRLKVEKEDRELDVISKLPSNANDLVVITMMKKLTAYVILVTENSPKRYRGVFVNRMQNYCLDALEFLLKANFIRLDTLPHKERREEYQTEAVIQLKLLGYMAMVSESVGCILPRQYKQISMQLAEVINLIVAWRKSDQVRWKKN